MDHPYPYSAQTRLVRATVLNRWRSAFVDFIDGGAGGSYAPTRPIYVNGAGLKIGGTDRLNLASRSIVRHQDMLANSSSSNWIYRAGNVWRHAAATGTLWVALENLPDGQSLDEVTLMWDGASGHSNDPVTGGGTPITMPAIDVYRVDEDGVTTLLKTQTDTTTGRTAYEAPHAITASGIGHTIDLSTYRYMVEVTPEDGAGYIANAEALSLSAKCVVTAMPEF